MLLLKADGVSRWRGRWVPSGMMIRRMVPRRRSGTVCRRCAGLVAGHALAGLGGTLLGAAAARLDEQRTTALEECLDLELMLGRNQ